MTCPIAYLTYVMGLISGTFDICMIYVMQVTGLVMAWESYLIRSNSDHELKREVIGADAHERREQVLPELPAVVVSEDVSHLL